MDKWLFKLWNWTVNWTKSWRRDRQKNKKKKTEQIKERRTESRNQQRKEKVKEEEAKTKAAGRKELDPPSTRWSYPDESAQLLLPDRRCPLPTGAIDAGKPSLTPSAATVCPTTRQLPLSLGYSMALSSLDSAISFLTRPPSASSRYAFLSFFFPFFRLF